MAFAFKAGMGNRIDWRFVPLFTAESHVFVSFAQREKRRIPSIEFRKKKCQFIVWMCN